MTITPMKSIWLAALCCVAAGASAWASGGRNRVLGSSVSIDATRAPIVVDGDLKEWDESRAELLTLTNKGTTEAVNAYQDYIAKVAFRYDEDALFVAVWWGDPTPLGPERNGDASPASDGLVLHLPFAPMQHIALWRETDGAQARAIRALGNQPWSEAAPLKTVSQGFRVTGAKSYTQEVRIPWAELGRRFEPQRPLRIGIELCYGGFDDGLGYRSFMKHMRTTGVPIDRWGGNIGWGFSDGFSDPERSTNSMDPALGARVKLVAEGVAAPANPPRLFMGSESTRTTEMVAWPAKNIVLDGRLEGGEWDARSATTVSSEAATFPGRYSVDIHWAYDEKGLYAGLRWHTGGQQFNLNDPAVVNRGYDGGDALQLRLGLDRVTHADIWYFTEGKRPAMALSYGVKLTEGKVPDALAKGALMALQPAQEGYTQEVFLPWSLITQTGRPLVEGQDFRALLAVFFSGREGNRIPFILNAQMTQPTGVAGLPFTAPEDGFYTVVIENAAGVIVRRLAAHAKLSKGETFAEWDGLTDEGEVAPAGDYRFRGLRHTGVGLDYLMSYNNPGVPPWRTVDNKGEWGGDHSSPQAVAADETGLYLGWPAAEDGDGIIAVDFEGRRQWGYFQTPRATSAGAAHLAVDGDTLYFLNDTITNPKPGEPERIYVEAVLSAIDRKTGLRTGFSLAKPVERIARYGASEVKQSWWWDLWRDKSFSLDTHSVHDDYFFSGRSLGGNATGLAVRGGRIYVSLRIPQEVVVFDAKDMRELARWPLPKPGGLAFTKSGELIAISDRSVVQIDPGTGKATPIVKTGLAAPVGLAIDRSDNLYVSDWADAQCVRVFTAKGVALRTIGKPGGRAWVGAYDPAAMLLPRGLAVDKDGKLWVAEDDSSPRRVSVWDAASGKLIKEFIGGTDYGAASGGHIDPANPAHAISCGVMYEIDLKKGGYRPLSTLERRFSKEQIFSIGRPSTTDRFVERDGRKWLLTGEHGALIFGELLPDGTWKARAAIGGVFERSDNPMAAKDEARLRWRDTVFPAVFAEHLSQNYVWTDLNGDGAVQSEEMEWSPQTKEFSSIGLRWGSGGVDKDFNAYVGGQSVGQFLASFAFQGWTESGAPKYSFNRAKAIVQTGEDMRSLAVGANGDVFTNINGERKSPKFQPKLTSYDANGKWRWSYNNSMPSNRTMGAITGDAIMGPVQAGGEAGEILGLTQWHGCQIPLITADGLFIARVLRDPSEGGAPGPDLYRGETIQFLNRLDDGRIILSHGKNVHNLFEVTGLASVRRFQGAFTLTPAQSALAAERLQTSKQQEVKVAPIVVRKGKTPVVVDGRLDEWNWADAVDIGAKTSAARGEVLLGLDDKNLYLAYRIVKHGAFFNGGKDVTQLFLTGDAVDLQFGTDPAANPARKGAVMGDTRLLLSKLGDKPVAVVYKASVPGAKKTVSFRSPTRAVEFDEVVVVDDAQVVITTIPDGYVVEAAVPLASIGLERGLTAPALWVGRVLRGDAGFIVGDATGNRVARIYRFNQDTSVISDIPTEATLSPDKWGEIEVRKP